MIDKSNSIVQMMFLLCQEKKQAKLDLPFFVIDAGNHLLFKSKKSIFFCSWLACLKSLQSYHLYNGSNDILLIM
ncbi:hypothetical protein FLACOL_00763 [Flavobacterium columnare]|uniref:Uncharacterized protein n=2 Tax=Flavobacterium TaxID=237 RepID=A0A2D0AIN1_9FLAO|nr:hypothetical protein BWK59_05380 [Flavobacterium davisii]SPE76774.1 hypothetical protein FLACOL_00763 [Flavobacterium columnare]